MALLFRSGRGSKLLVLGVALAALLVGPAIQKNIGGTTVDIVQQAQLLGFGKESSVPDWTGNPNWTDNSIGRLLIPSSTSQAIGFTPARMLLYLAAPLPNIGFGLAPLIQGVSSAWLSLMTTPTSLLNLLMFPYALAGFSRALKNRRSRPRPMVLLLSFWVTFIAVCGGNVIIHERYRVMATLLLFASVWYGYVHCRRAEVRRAALPWYGLLVLCALLYGLYKYF